MKVLVVDNYDSFTYNLVEYVSEQRLAAETIEVEVVKNRASLADVRGTDPDLVVVSPGPGHPENERDVGVTNDVFREVAPEVPTFGVCLGLEAAVYAYGGTVGHAPEPIHGKAFQVAHDGEGVFAGLDQGFMGGRYHSLVATEVPDSFAVTATTVHDADRDGDENDAAGGHASGGEAEELVMGVRHREHPIECVQFHPESVLTGVGHDVVRNALQWALAYRDEATV